MSKWNYYLAILFFLLGVIGLFLGRRRKTLRRKAQPQEDSGLVPSGNLGRATISDPAQPSCDNNKGPK